MRLTTPIRCAVSAVAGEREPEGEAERHPVDRGDHRLVDREAAHARQRDRAHAFDGRPPVRVVDLDRRADLAEVAAGGPGDLPGAGEDRNVGFAVVLELDPAVDQLTARVLGERVALLGPVDGEVRDAVPHLVADELVRHGHCLPETAVRRSTTPAASGAACAPYVTAPACRSSAISTSVSPSSPSTSSVWRPSGGEGRRFSVG
jgi:hypothetical protein